MQIIKMLAMASAVVLLTGCSVTTINQTEDITSETATGETAVEIVNTGDINNETTTGTETAQEENGNIIDITGEAAVVIDETPSVTGETAVEVKNNVGVPSVPAITDTPATVAEDTALKEKIRTLIEKRKAESQAASGLTEEDIQLMEDILKQIVEETR